MAAGWFFFIFTFICGAGPRDDVAIQRVVLNGNLLAVPKDGELNLGWFPKSISFQFGSLNSNVPPPIRIRAKLDGFEHRWRQGTGFMFLAVRFVNGAGEDIGQTTFPVAGNSPGWGGGLDNSSFTHRRETVTVPTNAASAWLVISSAGPPATVGIYAVANLSMSQYFSNTAPTVLVEPAFAGQPDGGDAEAIPSGWIQDGIHISMARIVDIGQDPPIKALAIEDNDPYAHAEWHTTKKAEPLVHPGARLVIEWNETYSIGEAGWSSVLYPELPAGHYRFHVMGLDLFGAPDGTDAFVKVYVPQPFWRASWFWTSIAVAVTALTVGCVRYAGWTRIRKEMVLLRNQRALENERLRIARDIHDDLGARITQMSMFSAASLDDPDLSEKVRSELRQIRQMSRDLLSSLYETVWVVNPEYDNLDSLGNYICQIVNQVCRQTTLRCRFYFSELPAIRVSSQIRHNITMAIKEAVHNIIKHARASEVVVHATYKDHLLEITIKDNGNGFQILDSQPGNGLKNMKQRMSGIGGSFSIDSWPGTGTQVRLSLKLN